MIGKALNPRENQEIQKRLKQNMNLIFSRIEEFKELQMRGR